MKRTILLTGKAGQVGSELLRLLPGIGEVVAPDRHELDLLNTDSIRRTVREIRQLIINAAAFTAVDAAEMQEAEARAINGNAPGVLAEEAEKIGAAVVHYSTDYVFDGSKTTPTMKRLHLPPSTPMEEQNSLVSRPFALLAFLT
jgi:dTDP-4-dehydrorhamnose reductase